MTSDGIGEMERYGDYEQINGAVANALMDEIAKLEEQLRVSIPKPEVKVVSGVGGLHVIQVNDVTQFFYKSKDAAEGMAAILERTLEIGPSQEGAQQ